MTYTVGIDLGTTNSVVSHISNGTAKAIEIDGAFTVPSVVCYLPDEVIVGRRARNLRHRHPDETLVSIKRHMGKPRAFAVGQRTVTPIDVSRDILDYLTAGARAALDGPITKAVITVPAYFDDGQRRATLEAGKAAGLEVLRLINEPTAASLIYEQIDSDQLAGSEHVMIYDLGGGTFDVSLLEVFEGIREVKATHGDTRLGGDDFDAALVARFVESFEIDERTIVESDAAAMARLARIAEDTKIALSSALSHSIEEEFLATTPKGEPLHFRHTVTRAEFETLISDKIDATIRLARKVLDESGIERSQLNRICLVGGSTRIPMVRERLHAALEVDIHDEIDADLAVALGAAIQGGIIEGRELERVLVDVSSHSLGVRAFGELDDNPYAEPDSFVTVLPRNTVLPAEGRREMYTTGPGQDQVQVEVFQGESLRASENEAIGEFFFELEPRPKICPVHFHFSYDLNGIVNVTVSQPETGKSESVAFNLSDGGHEGAGAKDAPGNGSLDTPLLRRCNALLETLSPDERPELKSLLDSYGRAETDERAELEEELLDWLVDHGD